MSSTSPCSRRASSAAAVKVDDGARDLSLGERDRLAGFGDDRLDEFRAALLDAARHPRAELAARSGRLGTRVTGNASCRGLDRLFSVRRVSASGTWANFSPEYGLITAVVRRVFAPFGTDEQPRSYSRRTGHLLHPLDFAFLDENLQALRLKFSISGSGSMASGIITPRSLIWPVTSSLAASAGGMPVCTTVSE